MYNYPNRYIKLKYDLGGIQQLTRTKFGNNVQSADIWSLPSLDNRFYDYIQNYYL